MYTTKRKKENSRSKGDRIEAGSSFRPPRRLEGHPEPRLLVVALQCRHRRRTCTYLILQSTPPPLDGKRKRRQTARSKQEAISTIQPAVGEERTRSKKG